MRAAKTVLVLAVALVGTAAMMGCPKKAPEAEEEGIMPGELPGEAGAPEGEPGAAAGEAKTMADIVGHWPSSFVMDVYTEDASGEKHTATMTMMMGEGGVSKIKIEPTDEPGVMVMDNEEKVMYSWDPDQGRGVRVALTEPDAEAEAQAPANPYDDVDPDAPIIGSETVDGVECWTVETSAGEGETEKVWIAKDDGLYRKMQSGDTTFTYEYSQVGEVPASTFEVPEDVEFMDLSDLEEMGRAMPEMPGAEGAGE
ncbi:MAG: hypothetical protein U9R79_08885 [Armatimonadota bacterium]|nr:hypothetical protein [Armatimonadota bacterium]